MVKETVEKLLQCSKVKLQGHGQALALTVRKLLARLKFSKNGPNSKVMVQFVP